MKKLYPILILIFISLAFSAPDKTYGSVTINRVVSVYDGDTLTVDIDKYPPIVGRSISVRVYGIDTPELKSKNPKETAKGYEAKAFVETRLKNAKVIELRNLRKDKYFRLLAEVYVDNQSLAKLLIQQGLAVAYAGGKKQNWAEVLR